MAVGLHTDFDSRNNETPPSFCGSGRGTVPQLTTTTCTFYTHADRDPAAQRRPGSLSTRFSIQIFSPILLYVFKPSESTA